MKFWVMFIFGFLLCSPAMAQSKLTLELAESRVDITTGFGGTRVVAFGTTSSSPGTLNLGVTIRGPETKMIVRQKERAITGVWSHGESVEFRRVPSYFDYALQNPDDLGGLDIGTESLAFYPEDDIEEAEQEKFRDSLIRIMQSKDLYPVKPSKVELVGDGLFKVGFRLPPGVPTGTYTVEAVLIENGQVLEKISKTLEIGQVGFNARVYLFAQEYSFFYGFLSVLLAVVFGWSAFTFLRRD